MRDNVPEFLLPSLLSCRKLILNVQKKCLSTKYDYAHVKTPLQQFEHSLLQICDYILGQNFFWSEEYQACIFSFEVLLVCWNLKETLLKSNYFWMVLLWQISYPLVTSWSLRSWWIYMAILICTDERQKLSLSHSLSLCGWGPTSSTHLRFILLYSHLFQEISPLGMSHSLGCQRDMDNWSH